MGGPGSGRRATGSKLKSTKTQRSFNRLERKYNKAIDKGKMVASYIPVRSKARQTLRK